MHHHDPETEILTQAIIRYAIERVQLDPPPLDQASTPQELAAAAGVTVTPEGIGGLQALQIFAEVLGPACISVDHPRFLSFVPAAPTEAAILFDLVVGASNVYAGSWLEGAGAVHAENEALRYIVGLAGMPETSGGVFVSGGTAGNLSALIAARWRWRHRAEGWHDRTRGLLMTSAGAHSSIVSAAKAMDADVVVATADPQGHLLGPALEHAIAELTPEDRERLFAIVATAGTTNAGVVDDLRGVAAAARRLDTWFHVDGAYGGAGLAAASVRHLFDGVEHADSFIVDPHKWLFAPFDSCALVYRDPFEARRAHTQHAEYLEVLQVETDAHWNPSDFAHHLSRRARGLPFWFSLATYGTDAYAAAIETTLQVARDGAALIATAPHLELIMEPELSVLLFRRVGWTPKDYEVWSERLLAEGLAFITPTWWAGEMTLRLCIVNPRTTVEDIALIVDSLRGES